MARHVFPKKLISFCTLFTRVNLAMRNLLKLGFNDSPKVTGPCRLINYIQCIYLQAGIPLPVHLYNIPVNSIAEA